MLGLRISPKHVAYAKSWAPTMALWGTTGGILFVYFTDWRLVLGNIPYIRGKFKKDD